MSIGDWFYKQRHNLLAGVISGLISSGLITACLKIPAVTNWIFNLPKAPVCILKKSSGDPDFVYLSEWQISLPENHGYKPFQIIHLNGDGYLLTKSFKPGNYIVEFFDGQIDGNFKGVLIRHRGKQSEIKLEFQVESKLSMEGTECENFSFSL